MGAAPADFRGRLVRSRYRGPTITVMAAWGNTHRPARGATPRSEARAMWTFKLNKNRHSVVRLSSQDYCLVDLSHTETIDVCKLLPVRFWKNRRRRALSISHL